MHSKELEVISIGYTRAEPNMLKILPIIPARTFQNFDPLFLFYSHIITYVLFLLILVNFIVSVIMMSTIHTMITASVDFSSEST